MGFLQTMHSTQCYCRMHVQSTKNLEFINNELEKTMSKISIKGEIYSLFKIFNTSHESMSSNGLKVVKVGHITQGRFNT